MIKLTNLITKIEKDVTFGTCEICMSVHDHVYSEYEFKDDKGNELLIETGYWDWGDYISLYSVDNVGKLAQYFLDNPIYELTYDTVTNHIQEYIELTEEWY